MEAAQRPGMHSTRASRIGLFIILLSGAVTGCVTPVESEEDYPEEEYELYEESSIAPEALPDSSMTSTGSTGEATYQCTTPSCRKLGSY